MESATFHYSERLPAEPLRPWLWNHWEFRAESASAVVPHHVPPDGCTSIAVVLEGNRAVHIAVSGPWLEPLVIPVRPSSRYWGVRCRPEGARLVLGTAPENLRNRNQPIGEIAPELGARLAGALGPARDFDQAVRAVEALFTEYLAGTPAPDSMAREAVDYLVQSRGEAAIGNLARELGTSTRTLLRRFRAATGLSPKQFARICRFRYAALTVLEPRQASWARVASGAGFADQAHLIHEFRLLTGLTPEELGDRIRSTRHGDLVI
jgi:AraC-like DNA-binding protein